MGYGDYAFWSAIVRDMYLEVNNQETIEKKIKKIAKYNKNYNKYKDNFGVIGCKKDSDTDNFKIYINIISQQNTVLVESIFEHVQTKEIFKNNPYVTIDLSYPNLIYLNIFSSGYFVVNNGRKTYFDSQHVMEYYANRIGLKKINIQVDLHFTKEEEEKVKENLSNEEFVYVEPQSYKPGRSYNFDKIQNIVNNFKNDIKFIQISPSTFAGKQATLLKNVTVFIDKFTFREAILYASYSKFCLLPHGGLSNCLSFCHKKTIVTYSCLFDPIMTCFKNEVPIWINSIDHIKCYNQHCNLNLILMKNHDENIIINKMKELLE